MATAATTARKNDSWWPLLWALAGFLVLPYMPAFNVMIPVQQTLLLLVAVIGVCGLVGWRVGARAVFAVIWIALAVWMLLQPAGLPGSQYDAMARGWAVLLAASFGLVSLWSDSMPFFSRALFAVGLAMAVGFVIALSSASGLERFEHAAGDEFTRRAAGSIQYFEERRSTAEWQEFAKNYPTIDASYDEFEAMIQDFPPRSASLLPALLALESLAALGVGWAVYRRLSQVQIGPTLGRLTDFRFNDQLVWGLAVGATLCLLPAFQEGRNAGYNLLLFFGTLYLIRGTGILAWISRGRYTLVVVLSLIPAVFIPVTIALGLGDTWLDIRNRLKPTSP
ncbi:MAG TPA: DUF2232 domain-containing protein [Gemmatimonadaceae bacterium]|nr:DUF2232 domain-containing protein [Gemmatimonadaceae bacterium]